MMIVSKNAVRSVCAKSVVLGALCVAALLLPAQGVEAQTRVIVVNGDHWDQPRLRFGVGAAGGGFVGTVHGGAGGLALQLGVQFNDFFAVYAQGHGLIGGFVPQPSDASVAGFALHTLMFEITLADMVQLGIGPAIDFYWGCSGANGGTTCGRGGAFLGGDLRVAVVLGGRGPSPRSGFTLSVDVHPTWLDSDQATMVLFGIGAVWY